MELFNIIAGLCSIASLLMSIFAVSKVVRIENQYKLNLSQSGSGIQAGGNIQIGQGEYRKQQEHTDL